MEGHVGKPKNCHIHYGAAILHKLTVEVVKKSAIFHKLTVVVVKKFATTICHGAANTDI
jgi:hypothetical protein